MLGLTPRRLSASFCAVAAAGLGLSGCLGDDASDDPSAVEGDRATVYLSLPRHGVAAPAARAVEAGARVALEDAGGRAGDLRIRLRDVSTTKRGELSWDPELVNANADRAADDPRAIAYLGELGLRCVRDLDAHPQRRRPAAGVARGRSDLAHHHPAGPPTLAAGAPVAQRPAQLRAGRAA